MNTRYSRWQTMLQIMWLWVALPGAGVSLFAADPSAAAKQEGRELAAEIAAMKPATNYFWSGALIVRDRSGNESQIPATIRVIVDSRSWRKEYEASITNGGFREKLVIIHDDSRTIRYLMARCKFGESFGDLAAVPADQLYQSFAQSDFSLLDLGLDFMMWPGQTVVKKEMRRSGDCRVLESIPAVIVPAGYSKVLSWVEIKSSGILLAEAYDSHQKRLKIFKLNRFTKINGRYELKEMEIRNLQTGSSTLWQFDPGKSGSKAPGIDSGDIQESK